jgi:hypothetical protein
VHIAVHGHLESWSIRSLRLRLPRAFQALIVQSLETVPWNRVRELYERSARLRMLRINRVQSNDLEITHEFPSTMLKAWIAVCLVPVLTVSCGRPVQSKMPVSQSQPQEKSAPPTPLAEKKAELGDEQTWNPDWDRIIEDALPPDLLSQKVARDVQTFCPRFNGLAVADKRAYWAYFFQALAGAEAGLRSTADVRHAEPGVAVVDSVSHRIVRSEGLLQLTFEDADRYGCDFDWAKDRILPEHDPQKTILQPKNNLLCGVKILTNQLIHQRKPLLSSTSYWSTLRPGWPGYDIFLKQMTNAPSACGRTGHRRESASAASTAGTSQSAANAEVSQH